MDLLDVLDVTVIEPRLKHPTIFEKFDSLEPGEAFVIHNDHDPKPLYYQLLAERGQTFTWDYLENGPQTWEVKIAKRNNTDGAETIGEIVAKDFRKAQVFKNMGIDFCCGGRKTIAEVCKKKGIDATEVERQLLSIQGENADSETDFQKWDIGFMTDYIVNTHHQYVKDNTSFIVEIAEKVAKVHGNRHPELIQVSDIFSGIGRDLTLHMMKEEKILFPFIKELAHYKKVGTTLPIDDFGRVSAPIGVMELEHEHAGEGFEAIQRLTANYTLPLDACSSYTILFKKLEEYENDLNRHVHLENNILFPKAIKLEKELSGQ